MGGIYMKDIWKRLVRDEKGAALLLAVILLLVGGLIAAPLLAHMGTGMLTGEVYERRTNELYAADAGVEDAIWSIQNGEIPVCSASPGPWCYEISDINGKSLQVCVEYLEGGIHRITSVAVGDSGGVAAIPSSTAVESYLSVTYTDFSSLLNNAIVSDTYIEIKNGVHVTGNVTSGGDVKILGNNEDVDGTVTTNADLDWPDAEDLSAWYLDDVGDAVQYYVDTVIDLEGNSCPPGPIYINDTQDNSWTSGLGPLYIDGEAKITSSNNQEVVTLKLSDTLYITGDTKIYGPNANEPYKLNIDLNGQTIFVESRTTGAKDALEIKDCTIVGSGCIIAVGDVYFAPKGDVGGEDDFVLVMSIDGTTTLRPSGTFYGCIAGDLSVDVQSGENATIINSGLAEGQYLNFPMGEGDDPNKLPPVTAVSIDSWEVIQQ